MAKTSEPLRPRGHIRLGPAGTIGIARRGLEVGWVRQAANDFAHAVMVANAAYVAITDLAPRLARRQYFFRFACCSAAVLLNA